MSLEMWVMGVVSGCSKFMIWYDMACMVLFFRNAYCLTTFVFMATQKSGICLATDVTLQCNGGFSVLLNLGFRVQPIINWNLSLL